VIIYENGNILEQQKKGWGGMIVGLQRNRLYEIPEKSHEERFTWHKKENIVNFACPLHLRMVSEKGGARM